MWYDVPPLDGSDSRDDFDWLGNIKKLCRFATIEEFWCLYNNMLPLSTLPLRGHYHMFVAGVVPAWEDKANARGGKWVINIDGASSSRDRDRQFRRAGADDGGNEADKPVTVINQLWCDVLMAVIGFTFTHATHIVGVVISPRKHQTRLALWTGDASNEEVVMSIGRELKALVGPAAGRCVYTVHERSQRKYEC